MQMAFDLGMEKESFKNEQKIQELLKMIEAEFDLVLLSEYMEVSMVLLADLMCWSLKDVTFLKLNARPANQQHTNLTTKDKETIRELNNVDTAIYTHFRLVGDFNYSTQCACIYLSKQLYNKLKATLDEQHFIFKRIVSWFHVIYSLI